MRTSQGRFLHDMDQIKTEPFLTLCRNGRPNVLVRNRKMPAGDLIHSLIDRKGLTLSMELRNYMNETHPGVGISKPGYLKQRMKLNPEALRYLFRYHNRNFYSDPDTAPCTYRGYLVLAADGSDINVPTTPETVALYGSASRKGTKPQAQIGLACLYDVLNHLIVDCDLNRFKFNEVQVAEQQISRVRETIGDAFPFMVLMDRGYPSIPAFIRMLDRGLPFVVRLSSIDFKAEQQALASDDEDVDIALVESRRKHYLGTGDEALVMGRDSFRLRLVRVSPDEQHSLVLATNLPRELFPAECFSEIYHLRWGIETAYDLLKNRLQMENFTGTKPVLLQQDIYSTIYVCNLAQDIARDSEMEHSEHLRDGYKHRMSVNRSICIGLLKNDLIRIIMEEDPARKDSMFRDLYDEIGRHLVPVRPQRLYQRNTSRLAAVYSNTHKRCY